MAKTIEEIFAAADARIAATKAPTAQTQVAPTAPTAVPTSKYSDLFSKADSKIAATVPTAVTPTVAGEAPTVDYAKDKYSESNLVEDKYFYPIQDYMIERFGVHIREEDRDEVVSQYVNNMRGFAGGNSVRSLGEIAYLNDVSNNPDSMVKAGQAYEIFEGMQGLTGDITWGETGALLWDYTRSAVADPVNLLGLGIGKVASGTGFKATGAIAMYAARQTFKKELATQTVGGVLKVSGVKAAQEVAETSLRVLTKKAVDDTSIKIAQRQALEKAATNTFQRMTSKTALKEGAIVGTFEGAVAAGTDYLYQDAMLRTKVQDEYNIYQTGLAAVVGLVAGGLSGMASNVRTGTSGLIAPSALKTDTKGSKVLSSLVNQTPSIPAGPPGTVAVPTGNWLKDIAKGTELKDQDTDFFITMLLGNDEKGLKGLSTILAEDGYAWAKRSGDDKVSNWIGDIIKEADPQDAKKFLDDFTAATGIDMADGKKLTLEGFADTFKRKMSDTGKVLNAASQMARILGRKVEDITGDDYADFVLSGAVPVSVGKIGEASAKIGKFAGNMLNRDLPDFQNNIIRLMVSNLSTTALNVAGYTTTTMMNSASDITRAALIGGNAALHMIYKPAEAKEMGITALGIIKNQMTKAKNILDVNTTYDTFLQYAQVRPEVMRNLTNIDLVTPTGLDLKKPLITMKVEQGVDFVQRLNLVNAQDGYTKAIEFTSQLDKFLRLPTKEGGFGMSWNEFFAQPTHPKMMLSEQYATLEAKAVDETLRATFGKSYKGKGLVGEVATIIEDARKIPGIGLLVPFGRFFNNTVAMTYNMTAVLPLIAKQFGGEPTKTSGEIIARGLVSWGAIYAISLKEREYMDLGLAWSEEIDPETGAVIDQKYAFPYGALKALARGYAHLSKGEEIPGELYTQVQDQFVGQLTRQLGDTGAGFSNIGKAIFSAEGPTFVQIMGDTLGTVVSQAASGITRPLEPVNALIGLSRDEKFYTPDRKQGTVWANNSFRYMDQGIALATGENLAPQKYNAAGGTPRTQSTRLISTTREDKLTSTERVMNMIGRPAYLANMASMSDIADNRFNQIFNNMVEDGARTLYESEAFKKGDLETRQYMVTNLLEGAKNSTKAYMGRLAANEGDDTLLKMIEISGKPKIQVERVLKSLNIEKSLEELSDAELETVALALQFREEYVLKGGK